MAKSSNKIGRWSRDAIAIQNRYDAHILREYGAFNESNIRTTAFRKIFKIFGDEASTKEASRRAHFDLSGADFCVVALSKKLFNTHRGKRRFGLRTRYGFSGGSLRQYEHIRHHDGRVWAFRRLPLRGEQ
ncbi:hypothetical protein [Thalassotalea euphylliae]|uniref:Uncharacterized protein n=1 Tax=Thalassotalea euphylliae TaxID=1655234 RepID=A0A3E0U2B3_9GAMM|nr:hypothetical protein [Thalassotalea euphylliae]REL31068.1 hypothetical protein DXX94_10275 [Thalassotalea euphylliae]